MTEQKKYTFTNPAFNLSQDYELLWKLIMDGHRIPAWVLYSDEYKEPIWDIVEVKRSSMNHEHYLISTRGRGYEGSQNFEGFIKSCIFCQLYFVIPNDIKECKCIRFVGETKWRNNGCEIHKNETK